MQRVSAPASPQAKAKQAAKDARDGAAKATTLKSLQDEVTKLAALVSLLVDQQNDSK